MPPVREREGDILVLIDDLASLRSQRRGLLNKRLIKAALQNLSDLPWKGKAREIRNVVDWCVILSETDAITIPDIQRWVHIPSANGQIHSTAVSQVKFSEYRNYTDKICIQRKLEGNRWNVTKPIKHRY